MSIEFKYVIAAIATFVTFFTMCIHGVIVGPMSIYKRHSSSAKRGHPWRWFMIHIAIFAFCAYRCYCYGMMTMGA